MERLTSLIFFSPFSLEFVERDSVYVDRLRISNFYWLDCNSRSPIFNSNKIKVQNLVQKQNKIK